ncbi:MAG TPA: hypothetical protein VF114_01650 [Candidatus Limnocylindria bacterium]
MRRPTGPVLASLALPLVWAALTPACGFFDPLDQRGLGVTLLPSDTAVYLDHEFQARGLMVNHYGDQYPSEHMSYGGPDSAATVTSDGIVHGRHYGRARVLVSREEFEAQAWVSVVPQGTLVVGRSPNFDAPEVDVMGVDGSAVGVVVAEWQAVGVGPAWLGDDILYNAADPADGAPHLFVVDLAGHRRRLVPASEIGFEGKARASRDGQWVYFVRRVDFAPGLGIWRIHPDGSGLEQVTENGDQDDPEPSPDGASLAYVALIPNVGYHLVIRNLASGEVLDLGVDGGSPRWSPDGKTIAFACGGNLCGIESDGGSPRFIATGDFYSGEALDWSPDGRWLLARGSTHLQVIDTVNGVILPLGYSPDMYFASWKP